MAAADGAGSDSDERTGMGRNRYSELAGHDFRITGSFRRVCDIRESGHRDENLRGQ